MTKTSTQTAASAKAPKKAQQKPPTTQTPRAEAAKPPTPAPEAAKPPAPETPPPAPRPDPPAPEPVPQTASAVGAGATMPDLPTASPARKRLWSVTDLNAKEQPRKHEPVAGQSYTLYAERAVEMPMEHAVRFLADKSFAVFNEEGRRVATMAEAGVGTTGVDGPRLAANEVVASLGELTHEALLARATRWPGGERFTADTPSELLAKFIVDQRNEREKRANFVAENFGADGVADGINPSTLKAMMAS